MSTSRTRVPARRRLTALLGACTAFFAVSVVAVVMQTTQAAASTGSGYLHTNGNKIVDSTGAVVRLTGLNWFGMETDNHTFHGLWAGRNATWKMQMDHMAALGFNTIRVPYTGDSLRAGAQATSINTDSNPDLVGLSPLQILDKVVDYAGQKGMRIFLDRHRPSTAGQTALWYTASVSEASEIADWQMLAQRYANNPTVIGADLFNEPHAEGTDPQGTGVCWGCNDPAKDWRLAAQRIGNAVLAANPNWLIIVEGVSCNLASGGVPNTFDNLPDDPMACDWWGGNLSMAATAPVQLNVANRLVYSAHDYGISVFDRQPWFNDPNFPNNLPDVWNHFWGYLVQQNIAPVLIGEFGSTLANPLDTEWMTKLMSYMGSGSNGMSFTYWSWNPDSGDTGGIVQDDWVTVQQNKMDIVGPFLNPPVGAPPSNPPPSSIRPSSGPPSSGPPSSGPPSSRPPSSGPPSSRPPSSGPPSSSPPPPGNCSVGYAIVSSWDTGFTANITVTNGGTSPLAWTLRLTPASGVTLANGWSATFAATSSPWTITPPSWQPTVPAGQSYTFGYQGNGPSTPAPNITCTS
jgi:endoglucanase